MASIKVYKGKTKVTPEVRAVFPHLNTPDRFGKYSVAVDLDDDLEAMFRKEAAEVVAEAQAELGTSVEPSNELIRTGEYKGTPHRRISFRMPAERTYNDEKIDQAPAIFDAQRNRVDTVIGGGSTIQIAYFFQYTITPTGCFITPKLKAVQIVSLVDAGGEVVEDLFESKPGFVEVQPAVAETLVVEKMPADSARDY